MYISFYELTILGAFFISTKYCIEGSLFANTRFRYDNGAVTIEMSDLSDIDPLKLVIEIDQPSLEFYKFDNCSAQADHLCLLFPQDRVEVIKTSDRCVSVNVSGPSERIASTKIHLGNVHLYGGAEHAEIKWPVEKLHYEEHPYVTTTYYYQAIVESYWLTSNGYYIYVDDSVPLFVSLESHSRILTLVSRKELPYVKKSLINSLNFLVCKFQNPRVAQLHAVNTILGKPTDIPDVYRVRYPIWSTWVKFKDRIDERLALVYAKEIANRGYKGQIEIDDNWERCYGSLEPDTEKFSHLKMTVKGIKRFGFKVTIWIHPFINRDCEPTYSMAKSSGYLVKNFENDTYVKWWRGKGGVIDFTNPLASRWFKKRLETLRHVYDIDSFKFDGGESDYSPKPAMYYKMAEDHPHTVVKSYVKMISSLGSNVHTRVAKGTQKYPIFVTMMDRESSWGNALGLYSMLPQVFQMNLLGYSFVLPDMIGGNAYNKGGSEELFIRWVQVNTFLPSMQFSILPWEFSENCAEITRKFVDLHYNYSDTIIKLMKKNVQTGAPINPPIWWIAPLDEEALKCDNEFLLGENILIAPVLLEGATSRDIYLPAGYWKDENHPDDAYIKGPVWLYNYDAPIHILPYFTKVNSFNVETLVYLKADTYQNSWMVFIVTVSIMIFIYIVFQIITRCLRVRKRVLTWYSKLKWTSCRLRK